MYLRRSSATCFRSRTPACAYIGSVAGIVEFRWETKVMKRDAARYRGYRFPAEIISYAIWVYHRFCMSLRDVEDLLAQRGIVVSYETIRAWCRKFGARY